MVKKKRGLEIKKKYIQIIFSLIILSIGIFAVYALVDETKAWHNADEILITIKTTFTGGYFDMTLQEAIDNKFLARERLPTEDIYTKKIPDPGHSADDILIEISGFTMTLQEAIDKGFFIGRIPTEDIYTTTLSSSGHIFATLDQILITLDKNEMTLQEAISDGEFCAENSCGGNCGTCEEGYDCSAEGVCETIDSPLYNGVHMESECVAAGGVVYSNFCRFSYGGCYFYPLSGWSQMESWTTTIPGIGTSPINSYYDCTTCITGSHDFANIARETCIYQTKTWHGDYIRWTCDPTSPRIMYATITEVGCY